MSLPTGEREFKLESTRDITQTNYCRSPQGSVSLNPQLRRRIRIQVRSLPTGEREFK